MVVEPGAIGADLLPGEVERPEQPPARSPRVAEIVERAGAHRDHFAFLRLLLDGVGDNDPTRRFLVFG